MAHINYFQQTLNDNPDLQAAFDQLMNEAALHNMRQQAEAQFAQYRTTNFHFAPPKPSSPPRAIDKAARRKEIEAELDIVRGIVPTPKGYKVDQRHIKAIMIELRGL